MKIILKAEVKKLGKKGDVVEVSEGYARNYILPKGLGLAASKENMAILASEKRKVESEKKEKLAVAESLAKELERVEVKIAVKSGEGGRLFGSVTSKEIAEDLKKQFGIKVDKRKIEMEEHIKTLGTYKFKVKIHPEVQSRIKVVISEAK